MIPVQNLVFSLGALMFYYSLYRARLVPRWLSGWGLVAIVAYLGAGVTAIFSTNLVVLLLPLAAQEMVLAIWLIVKGFTNVVRPDAGDFEPNRHALELSPDSPC